MTSKEHKNPKFMNKYHNDVEFKEKHNTYMCQVTCSRGSIVSRGNLPNHKKARSIKT